MSWELITTATQTVSGTNLIANFTNVPFTDVAFFAIVMNGKAGTAGQGSNFRIGNSSGVSTASAYDMESFIISGGVSAGVSYYQAVNQVRFPFLAMSVNEGYTASIIYLGSDFHNNDKPLCFWKASSEEMTVEGSGWLDVTLTDFGEVKWEAEAGNIDAGSYMSVYKVLSS